MAAKNNNGNYEAKILEPFMWIETKLLHCYLDTFRYFRSSLYNHSYNHYNTTWTTISNIESFNQSYD